MPDDLIPPQDPVPTGNPPPPPPEPRRSTSVVCEFCECTIAPDGGVLKMSDVARGYVKSKDRIASIAADLEACQGDLTRANAEIAQLRAANQPAERRPVFDLRRKST